MATTDELLASLESSAGEVTIITYEIDSLTRNIGIPNEFLLGVESDEKVNRVHFRCPRYVATNVDLMKMRVQVNYQNAIGAKGVDYVDDVAIDADNKNFVTFSWLLSRDVTAYKGQVIFTICATTRNSGRISTEWNTIPAKGFVAVGLETEEYGDTLSFVKTEGFMATLLIEIDDAVGYYAPEETDVLTFMLKKSVNDLHPLIEKTIPSDTCLLNLQPEETQMLTAGEYLYGVKMEKANGEIHTLIPAETIILLDE